MVNKLPPLNWKDNPTGCCPRFDPKPWDENTVKFKDKKFIKGTTLNFMHIPLTMGRMMKREWERIEKAGANPKDTFAVLSYDPSPWKGEHYLTVTKNVPGADNTTLSGTYMTKVFEGPYKDAKKWVGEMEQYVKSKRKKLKKLYFYYTTCPKCIKTYGKNYTVAFAQV
ncbi:hydrolase [Patescibacteria group bacterium]